MSIFTERGDTVLISLPGGIRVSKAELHHELISKLGNARAICRNAPIRGFTKLMMLIALTVLGGITPLGAQTRETAQNPVETKMVVTASRAREAKREVTSNVTVIDDAEIQASTAQTLAELLVEQGFNSASYNDVAGVQIRGFGNLTGPTEYTNTVLILLNGRRTGNANFALTGLANVERIEIIRGPSAVQYGSSAMGGVINIITKRGGETPIFSLEAGLGSDQLKRERLAFSGATKGFDLAVGVTNNERSDLTTNGGRRWYNTAIDHNVDANVDLGYSVNRNHRAGANFNYGDIYSQLPSAGIRPYSGNTPTAPFTRYQKNTNNLGFSYAGNSSGKAVDWSADYSFGNYDQLPYTNYLDTKFFNAQSGFNQSLFSVSYGLDNYRYESDPSSWAMKDAGFYASGKLRPFEKALILSAGLRHDRFTNESTVLTDKKNNTGGSVGVAYLPRPWMKLRANYAHGFKMPSPEQVAGDGAVYYLANLSLQPERSKTAEFGGDVDWKYVEAGLTWFFSDWENKIIGLSAPGSCSGGYGCFMYQNLQSSTLNGLESSVRANLAKALGLTFNLTPYISMTWLQKRQNGDSTQFITYNGSPNDTLPNTPDWLVSYGIKYTDPVLKIKGQINAAYYGSVLTQDWSVVDFVTVFSAPYIKRPTGTVVNMSFEKELGSLGNRQNTVTLRTEVDNLFDGANEMYWGYPGTGRRFYIGLRFDHK